MKRVLWSPVCGSACVCCLCTCLSARQLKSAEMDVAQLGIHGHGYSWRSKSVQIRTYFLFEASNIPWNRQTITTVCERKSEIILIHFGVWFPFLFVNLAYQLPTELNRLPGSSRPPSARGDENTKKVQDRVFSQEDNLQTHQHETVQLSANF